MSSVSYNLFSLAAGSVVLLTQVIVARSLHPVLEWSSNNRIVIKVTNIKAYPKCENKAV